MHAKYEVAIHSNLKFIAKITLFCQSLGFLIRLKKEKYLVEDVKNLLLVYCSKIPFSCCKEEIENVLTLTIFPLTSNWSFIGEVAAVRTSPSLLFGFKAFHLTSSRTFKSAVMDTCVF